MNKNIVEYVDRPKLFKQLIKKNNCNLDNLKF